MEIKLAYKPPYHWEAVIRFLAARAVPGLEVADPDTYRRRVRFDGIDGVIEVVPVPGESFLLMRAPAELSDHRDRIAARTGRLFDLDADPVAIAGHLRKDRELTEIVSAYPGLRVPGAWDGFEIAVRAIVGQQISVKAATTMMGRLVDKYGRIIEDGFESGRLFPSPERLAEARMEEIGLISRRAETIRALSKAVAEGILFLEPGDDLRQTVGQLTAFTGIGDWTANYIAMRAGGQDDAFPAGDLVLRRITAGGNNRPLTEKQLSGKAHAWRPYRAYATMYLWMHCHFMENK